MEESPIKNDHGLELLYNYKVINNQYKSYFIVKDEDNVRVNFNFPIFKYKEFFETFKTVEDLETFEIMNYFNNGELNAYMHTKLRNTIAKNPKVLWLMSKKRIFGHEFRETGKVPAIINEAYNKRVQLLNKEAIGSAQLYNVMPKSCEEITNMVGQDFCQIITSKKKSLIEEGHYYGEKENKIFDDSSIK